MPTRNDELSPPRPAAGHRPSLFGAAQAHAAADNSPRVLADLEGRSKGPALSGKAFGGGAVAFAVLALVGLGAWKFASNSTEAPPTLLASAHPDSNALRLPREDEPAPSSTPLTDTASEPEPARIIDEPASASAAAQPKLEDTAETNAVDLKNTVMATATATDTDTGETVIAPAVLASAPVPATTSASKASNAVNTASRQRQTASSTSQRSNAANTKAKATAKPKTPVRHAAPDPDADLLAALLQRRDPRTADDKPTKASAN